MNCSNEFRAGRDDLPLQVKNPGFRTFWFGFRAPPLANRGVQNTWGVQKLVKSVISNDNLVIIDWLTVSSTIWSESDLIDLFHLSGITWEEVDCYRYGYRHRKSFGGISILSDGHQESMGICFEMSGQGCRTFEDFSDLSWFDLLSLLIEPFNEFRITHIDLAFDDHTGILDMDQLLDDTDEHRYRSRSRWWKVEYGSTGTTIYHGSPQSKIRVRIYDKALERGLVDGTHWIRVEVVLRDQNAIGAVQSILDQRNTGAVFSGILSNYLVYCDPSTDSNKSRWDPTDYWQQLLQAAAAIHIAAKPGVEYNIFRLAHYLFDQAGGAIYTWIQINGLDSLEEMIKKRNKRLNPNHQALLDQYKRKEPVPDET